MKRQVIIVAVCFMVVFSVQITYAQEKSSLPEGKNIREWESISAVLVGENRFAEAIIYLDKILEEDPKNLKALSNKSGLLIKLEKFSESVILSDRVLEIDPDRISTLTNKAIALEMLNEYEESFLVFSKIIYLEPENEAAQISRAKLLSATPTIPTEGSKYTVHAVVTIRDGNGNLIATTESTNARYLPSLFTEKWWNQLEKKEVLKYTKNGDLFTKTNPLIPNDDYIGMLTLERQMSGYNISIFELFIPMIQMEKTDTAQVQWTIIKN